MENLEQSMDFYCYNPMNCGYYLDNRDGQFCGFENPDDYYKMIESLKNSKKIQRSLSHENKGKKKELYHLSTSPDALRRVEELARLQEQQRPEAEPPLVVRTPPRGNSHQEAALSEPAASEKEKVLLQVQDDSGYLQHICKCKILATDKFEKLFKAYAHQIQVPLEKLVFRFDGDDISHNSTPKELDLEDDDIVEAYIKS